MKTLSADLIEDILNGDYGRAPNDMGPLGVLLQAGYCTMCRRQQGPNVTAIYTVNDDPLCTPHALYVLSKICVENNYQVQIEGKVESDKSSS